ncbi:MAG TPA: hypothetical protein VGF87_07260, partial [Acidimicrobiales bacterium]
MAVAMAAVLGQWTSVGAAGILPPSNPSQNIAPESTDWLQAINMARGAEGVGPMAITETAFDALPLTEQLFTVINLERIDRGLQPIQYLTSE